MATDITREIYDRLLSLLGPAGLKVLGEYEEINEATGKIIKKKPSISIRWENDESGDAKKGIILRVVPFSGIECKVEPNFVDKSMQSIAHGDLLVEPQKTIFLIQHDPKGSHVMTLAIRAIAAHQDFLIKDEVIRERIERSELPAKIGKVAGTQPETARLSFVYAKEQDYYPRISFFVT